MSNTYKNEKSINFCQQYKTIILFWKMNHKIKQPCSSYSIQNQLLLILTSEDKSKRDTCVSEEGRSCICVRIIDVTHFMLMLLFFVMKNLCELFCLFFLFYFLYLFITLELINLSLSPKREDEGEEADKTMLMRPSLIFFISLLSFLERAISQL